MTQKDRILQALKEAKEEGINSYIARDVLQIIQLPTRIFELKELGYNIVERTNSNRSVNYILLGEPKLNKLAQVKEMEQEFQWVVRNGNTLVQEPIRPEQRGLGI